ncbi:LytTr DNA-binding domain-containing protein [Arcicella aurantiaca]|uniref:LytTr DNA-binding domain-containing protein n=1 Tax=Arcicella aurantiaca TaxID=591202 RepID=A0A316EDA5_9BACT|nr:LytTR family DNA-binding domain-containing protein [Arcicella aurantiaca]PWK27360.1 LytTr DNA-binding domain-containing protein [Arcicella aurantiaca]
MNTVNDLSISKLNLYVYKSKIQIDISNIIMLEAQVNYTIIYLKNGKKMMVSKTLKSFEELLLNYRFYRIHRAFLINSEHLQAYDSTLGQARLTNDYTVSTSRRKKEFFEKQMNRASLTSIKALIS